MSVLYVTQPGAEVHKQGGRLKVMHGGETLVAIPLREVERVVLLGPAQLSAAAIRALLEASVPVLFCGMGGKYYGALTPAGQEVDRWLHQVERWLDDEYRLAVARAVVGAKVRHQRSLLRRQARNYRDEHLQQAADQLDQMLASLPSRETVAQVMGVEGQSSALYFSVFGRCLRRDGLGFNGRNRRPPRDPVNALLSLGYMLLLGEVSSALLAQGLQVGLGFLHEPTGKRPSLALDLLEIFRQPVVDRLTLTLLNLQVFTPRDFDDHPSTGVRLKPDALKRYLEFFNRALTTSFRHPVEQRSVTHRDLVREQAFALRRSVDEGSPWSPLTWEL